MCITAGRAIVVANDMVQEALALHTQGTIEDGEHLPDASKVEDIMTTPDSTDFVAFLVIGTKDDKP